MPPAFVLSQDQTLHKLKFVYQIIWSKHYLFDLRLIMKFSRFTSHYSIFNQLLSFKSAYFIIYHQFRFCQIYFWRFFIFYSASRHFQFNFVSLSFGAFYNIDPIFYFCKLNFKLFSKVFIQFRISSISPASLSRFYSRGAKRDIIYHRVAFCQAVLQNFLNFSFSLFGTHLHGEANRDII